MGFAQFVRAVRRMWWLVLISFLVFTGVGAGLAYGLTPKYESTVTFFVSSPGDNGDNPFTSVQSAQQRALSYALVLNSDRLGDEIASDASIGLSGHSISKRITTVVPTGTVLVTGNVEDTSRSRALAISRAMATKFPALVSEVDKPGTSAGVTLSVTSGPRLLSGQVFPNKKLYIGLGAIVGIFIGLVVVFLRELFKASSSDSPSDGTPRSAPGTDPLGEGQHRSERVADSPGDDFGPWRGEEQPVGRGGGEYRQQAGWARGFGSSGPRHRPA